MRCQCRVIGEPEDEEEDHWKEKPVQYLDPDEPADHRQPGNQGRSGADYDQCGEQTKEGAGPPEVQLAPFRKPNASPSA